MDDSERFPAHWRERAEDARALADSVGEPEVKQLLGEVAERYDKITTILKKGPLTIGNGGNYTCPTRVEPKRQMAKRHIAEQQRRIVRQEELIHRLSGRELPIEQAKQFLQEMETMLDDMRAELASFSH